MCRFFQGVPTYHRGFGVMFDPVDHSIDFLRRPTIDLNKSQSGDPSAVYRGSVLSSTTVSSNHDELMQAYEYGRKHQLRSCLVPGHMIPMGGDGPAQLQHVIPSNHMVTAQFPMGINESEISGGSVSSDATDSGIRQFTQQPPQPDEARHGACKVPFVCDGEFFLEKQTFMY